MENSFFDSSVFDLNANQWLNLAPYLWLCFGIALATIAAGLRLKSFTLKTLCGLILLPFVGYQLLHLNDAAQPIFGTSLEVNAWVRLCGASLGIFAFLSSLFCKMHDDHDHPEWGPLLFISLLGLSLLPGARDWLAFFVALETLAICGYVMTALDTERERSLEAGLKYLFMGSFASALFLMGLACLYGFAGSLDYEKIKAASASLTATQSTLALAGMMLVVTSLAFKVALFPFHMWAPDVYQAAPTALAAFMASATKLSVFTAMALAFEANGFFAFAPVKQVLAVLGVLSVVGGSFLAVVQRRLRRMLAYSSVVSAGYAALGLASGYKATGAVMGFLIFYGLSVICAFSVIENYLKVSENRNLDDVAITDLPGLARATPLWLGACFAVAMFSMAGIPPLPGFMGKYLILKELLVDKYYISAAVLLFGSFLGLAYYLRVLVPIYLDTKGDGLVAPRKMAPASALAAVLCVILMFYLLFQLGRLPTI